ncbi:hypothetical protein M011DRAFT_470776 [Sporormia fimetaria CBS 119925]|uniref:SnoaL-like domain-containing protein n=1 Tax=Sporormia fimetaria CBS 119925 TaxID=1340428 RepID=A0A6A6V4K0_9PLEO|nr:hypothetical protein M011DRAFT_470776 [Sporormia fimetaria CBS 119925]
MSSNPSHHHDHSHNHHGCSAADVLAIRNTLSRYCEALDTKVFDLLDKVFTKDVVADYPFNADLKGVDAVREAIINRSVTPLQLAHINSPLPKNLPLI